MEKTDVKTALFSSKQILKSIPEFYNYNNWFLS